MPAGLPEQVLRQEHRRRPVVPDPPRWPGTSWPDPTSARTGPVVTHPGISAAADSVAEHGPPLRGMAGPVGPPAGTLGVMADITFYFDPVCPFAWMTSKWVRKVQAQRDYTVEWRFISLRQLNAHVDYDAQFPPDYEAGHTAGLRLLRVATRVRAEGSAAGSVDTRSVGRGPAGRMSPCRRSSPWSSSVTWFGWPDVAI
ncbi:hypothetical protein GCM10027047_14060 [Rhodococcus aerolatus]